MKLTGEKTCPSAILSTTNPTWTDPGVRSERQATNRLSHGTASFTQITPLTLQCHLPFIFHKKFSLITGLVVVTPQVLREFKENVISYILWIYETLNAFPYPKLSYPKTLHETLYNSRKDSNCPSYHNSFLSKHFIPNYYFLCIKQTTAWEEGKCLSH